MTKKKRLWDKGVPLDQRVLTFTVGDDYLLDARLVEFDAQASSAHADMLEQQGLLAPGEARDIGHALAEIAASHGRGEWTIALEEEDVHTALENRLVESLGEVGKKVHLGRSRNDQVLAALRLYMRSEIYRITSCIKTLIESLNGLIGRQGDLALPGYTHTQIAMPSTVAMWAGGYIAALQDDAHGLSRTLARININPLGSAAGYGTPGIDIDRSATTKSLGFNETQSPVTAVQLSRGKAEASLIFELTLLMADLGKMASDLILFASKEFSLVRLGDSITTGSSIMPQKRNPDIFELVRGRSAQFNGILVEALSISSKLTSGYHRDMQLLKQPLFRAIDSAIESVNIMVTGIDQTQFVEKTLPDEVFATEKANAMAASGIPFRDAYAAVAKELQSKRK